MIDDIDVIAKTYCLQHSKANFPVQLLNELRKNLQTAIKAKARYLSIAGFLNLAPLTGLEPVTYGLTVRRSTD